VLRLVTTVLYSIEIGNDIELGEGINFAHTVGTVIDGTSKVSARVKFMGNNTIGTAKDGGCPVIEDDVVIGCGARVLGPVRIGRGASIGANAVVLTDIPPGAVATGIPAKVHPLHDEANLRTIWQGGRARVDDAGPDGNPDTTADNTVFAVQGVFVP
jgi:serine O-acetyltransferase